MSKKVMSKNTTIKKVKKLERQKKYKKALSICNEFLDNKLEKEIIQIKTDLLTNIYYTDNFVDKANEYKIKLNKLLDSEEYIEILKIFKILEDFLQTKANNLTAEKDVKIYLSGGLILDSLETILVLNEIIKSNENTDIENSSVSKIPDELKEFIKDVKATSYQYLGLTFENPVELIKYSNINTEEVVESIQKLINPEPEDNSETVVDKDNNTDNANINDTTETEEINSIESLKEEIANLNHDNKFVEALAIQKKLVKIAKRSNLDKSSFVSEDYNQKTLFNFK